jgi:hypothetical protein
MVIIAASSYPLESAKEVGKRLLEMPPVPSFMTLKGPFLDSEVGTGVKSINLFEFDRTKTAEAMDYVLARMANYIGVPGFTYSVRVWLEAKEGLAMIGLA